MVRLNRSRFLRIIIQTYKPHKILRLCLWPYLFSFPSRQDMGEITGQFTKHGGLNITGLTLFDVDNQGVKRLTAGWLDRQRSLYGPQHAVAPPIQHLVMPVSNFRSWLLFLSEHCFFSKHISGLHTVFWPRDALLHERDCVTLMRTAFHPMYGSYHPVYPYTGYTQWRI